jgi:hypothetical protein
MRQAREYLNVHPELYQQALERARRMGYIDPAKCKSNNKRTETERAKINHFCRANLSCEMIDIEREIAWLLAQQFRGLTRQLVERSKGQ